MKIAQVCHRYHPDIGGVETHVKEISERLVEHGYDIEVICTDSTWKYPKQEYYKKIKITRFGSLAPKNAFYFAPQLYFYLKNRNFDIVHVHNYHAFPAFFASVAVKGRLVFTPHYHGRSSSRLRNMLLKPYNHIARYIFEKAEKVICVSRYEMKLIENNFHVPKSKLVHIPNGVSLKVNIKEIKKDSKLILYAGRLESYKGVQYIIEALPLLKNYRLMIIGKGSYEKELHRLAKKLKVNNRIEWLKDIKREELLSYFKSADVFVNLSSFEAYGIAVAEALALGTPCIVGKGGALEEFIDGEGCVGIDYPIDVEALADLINRRKRVTPREMPDWDDVTSDLIRVYLG